MANNFEANVSEPADIEHIQVTLIWWFVGQKMARHLS